MICKSCGCIMDDTDKFCPACGAKAESDKTAVYQSPAPTREYNPSPTKEYAPVDSGYAANAPEPEVDNRTMVMDGYHEPSAYAESYAQPLNPRGGYPQDYYGQQRPQTPQPYQDSFEQQSQPRFEESGWEDPDRSERRRYERTTPGRRLASIFMCLMLLLFSFFAMMIGTARLGLTEDNVRKAYQKGSLADLRINTEKGEQSLGQVLMDNVVDAKTNLPIQLDGSAVDSFLRTPLINNFTENLAVDFTQFFVFGKTPSLLNSGEITKFLTSISGEIKEQINYSMSEEDIETIGKRIDGGDLSFLSIDANGGYFKTKYGFSPYTISSFFSVWALGICAGLALLCMVMVFVINHGNLPAGLSFNGGTMIIFGVLNTLIAAALLIFSYLKPIFLVGELLRSCAFAMGAISIVVLVVGILFSVIKTVLRNRI